jgi:hypothetical protein
MATRLGNQSSARIRPRFAQRAVRERRAGRDHGKIFSLNGIPRSSRAFGLIAPASR